MDFLGDFHFLRPWWFLALPVLAGILWLLWRKHDRDRNWERVCDRRLLPYILTGRIDRKRKTTLLPITIAGLLAILALAGPTNEKQPQPAVRDHSALVIAFDLSRSMDAIDLEPNRLTRAKYKINDLLKIRKTGQTGLIVYAADAFTVMPLTDDLPAVEQFLSSLDTSLLSEQGSRPDLALQQSASLIKQAGLKHGDILIVSDYVDTKRSLAIARDLAEQSFRISTLGIGSQQGAPIQLKSGQLLTHRGETVIARFEPQKLKTLAQVGGGIYQQFDPRGNSDIVAFNNLFQSEPQIKEGADGDGEIFGDKWKEQGPWLIIPLLPLAVLAFRRGILLLALGVGSALVLSPVPSHADLWDNLWWRNDQQGVTALKRGDHDLASELLSDPRWQSANAYREGNYETATKLVTPQTATDWYNRGNALAHQGKIKDAISAYEQALELSPEMEDAQHNLDILKRLKAEEQKSEAQQSDDEEQSESDSTQQNEQQNTEQGEQNKENSEQNAEQSQENQEQGEQSQQNQQNADDESQQEDQEQEEQRASKSKEGSEADAENEENTAFSNEAETLPEDEQAIEQWLRQIGNDPAQLLKRKFQYQQRRENKNKGGGNKPW